MLQRLFLELLIVAINCLISYNVITIGKHKAWPAEGTLPASLTLGCVNKDIKKNCSK